MNIRNRIVAATASILLAFAGVALVAGPASAHNKSADISCITASVNLTSYDQGATALVTLDGTVVYGYNGTSGWVGSTFDGSYVQTWPLTSDATHTSHRLQVTVISTDGAQYNLSFDQTASGCYTPPPPTPVVNASVTGVMTCDAANSLYTIAWTGSVTGVFDGYVAQRVKFTSTAPAVTVADGVSPGTGFSYVTTAPGSATSATAAFHVHVTQASAGVNPLDTDATGNVTMAGDCAPPPPVLIPVEIVPATSTDATCDAGASYALPIQPTGIKYALDAVTGIRPVAGTFTLADGASVTVVAHSIAGYVPVNGSWTFTGHEKLAAQSTDADAPCYTAPTPTPTPTDPPVPPTTQLTTPAPLAETGVNAAPGFIAGWLLLMAGISVLAIKAARRKTV